MPSVLEFGVCVPLLVSSLLSDHQNDLDIFWNDIISVWETMMKVRMSTA